MAKLNQLDTDLIEIHHLLTRAILFLARNYLEGPVETLLKVKLALPIPKMRQKPRGVRFGGDKDLGRFLRTDREGQ